MNQRELDYISARRGSDNALIVPPVVPVVRTPQFPGVKPGMSIEQVREVIRNQKRTKGFQFDLSVGAQNNFDLALSGTARLFLGFALTADSNIDPSDFPDQFTIVINNEIVIQETFPGFFTQEFMDDEYYFIPRPLSGQDTITATFRARAAISVFMVVYYI